MKKVFLLTLAVVAAACLQVPEQESGAQTFTITSCRLEDDVPARLYYLAVNQSNDTVLLKNCGLGEGESVSIMFLKNKAMVPGKSLVLVCGENRQVCEPGVFPENDSLAAKIGVVQSPAPRLQADTGASLDLRLVCKTDYCVLTLLNAKITPGGQTQTQTQHEKLECPDTCEDNNPCTRDYCGQSTNFVCAHEALPSPCCGNMICETSENYVNCPRDCVEQQVTQTQTQENVTTPTGDMFENKAAGSMVNYEGFLVVINKVDAGGAVFAAAYAGKTLTATILPGQGQTMSFSETLSLLIQVTSIVGNSVSFRLEKTQLEAEETIAVLSYEKTVENINQQLYDNTKHLPGFSEINPSTGSYEAGNGTYFINAVSKTFQELKDEIPLYAQSLIEEKQHGGKKHFHPTIQVENVTPSTYAVECLTNISVALGSPSTAESQRAAERVIDICLVIEAGAAPQQNQSQENQTVLPTCAEKNSSICPPDWLCENGVFEQSNDSEYCCVGGYCAPPVSCGDGECSMPYENDAECPLDCPTELYSLCGEIRTWVSVTSGSEIYRGYYLPEEPCSAFGANTTVQQFLNGEEGPVQTMEGICPTAYSFTPLSTNKQFGSAYTKIVPKNLNGSCGSLKDYGYKSCAEISGTVCSEGQNCTATLEGFAHMAKTTDTDYCCVLGDCT